MGLEWCHLVVHQEAKSIKKQGRVSLRSTHPTALCSSSGISHAPWAQVPHPEDPAAGCDPVVRMAHMHANLRHWKPRHPHNQNQQGPQGLRAG